MLYDVVLKQDNESIHSMHVQYSKLTFILSSSISLKISQGHTDIHLGLHDSILVPMAPLGYRWLSLAPYLSLL